jgi:hypothetical protein
VEAVRLLCYVKYQSEDTGREAHTGGSKTLTGDGHDHSSSQDVLVLRQAPRQANATTRCGVTSVADWSLSVD